MAGAHGILPLTLRDVRFAAGGRDIIDGISAGIEAGPTTIILGANGAGKSVLMRLMHGLLRPTSGEIVWHAQDEKRVRRGQAMVFQHPVMLRRTALANILYALELAHVTRAEREQQAMEALREVGLSDVAHRPARVLSGGEQQRLALARAWALHPEVLFLDEPTANLDPGATREIENVIKAFDASGTKIVMSTHNLGQARRLGDEVLFIHQGRLAERAAVERFFAGPTSSEAAAFVKGELPWV
jgi:tungstate transport system ATP-binding protein